MLRRESGLVAVISERGTPFALTVATAVVSICTALVFALKQIAPVDSLGVVYMVAVLLMSAVWGIWLGLFTSIESALAFDYFQLKPVGTLSLRHTSDWVALATFVIAATVGGHAARVARSRSDVVASRARIIAAADAARERLARDLHDGTQQRLVTTILNLQLAEQQFERDPRGTRLLLQAALTEAAGALTELRELAHGVHPSILTNRGLAAATASLSARSPVPVDVSVDDQRYPPPIEAAVYFFIAEALTNVAKHAQASHSQVRVRHRDGRLLIDVIDDGIGGADTAGGGIRGLRDRIEALGGQMRVVSPHGHGTHLHATIDQPGEALPSL